MLLKHKIALALLLVIGYNSSAQELITNGSFEQGVTPYEYLPNGDTRLTGWDVVLDGVELFSQWDVNSSTSVWHGFAAIDLAPVTFTGGGGIRQTIATQIDATYTVSLRTSTSNFNGRLGYGTLAVWIVSGSTTWNPYWTITNYSNDLNWEHKTSKFTATDTSTTIWLYTYDDPLKHFVFIDGVSVTKD
jgi:hypothetical protein